MNNKEYDKLLQTFHAGVFKRLYDNYEIHKYNELEKKTKEMLMEYGNNINNTTAVELLTNIELKSNTVEDILFNYPDMFWQTKGAEKVLRKIADLVMEENFVKVKSYDPDETVTELVENISKVVGITKKIIVKDTNNVIASSLLEHYLQKVEKCCISEADKALYNNTINEEYKKQPNFSNVPSVFMPLLRVLEKVKYEIGKESSLENIKSILAEGNNLKPEPTSVTSVKLK